MAKSFDACWDRVVREIALTYGMKDKVREINVRKGLIGLERTQ